ncbi:DEAD/DEAH box helicase family protein [Mycoplasmopsis citelli]|uniref:DEAD/DEAH box helicase n=1 Tax=Mycoplasmopsis citelli TaxID=171281 RepID=UPI0021143CD4|nr:DEAD/DEAH box helicase family protein [Mycoplasmopsis citelli]UUD35910.1 DEAD/DEAH box helicase family protein [Mycoplasmopsis citelli]
MSFNLSKVQKEAVERIFSFWENRHENEHNKKVIFKAPTGSGKTFMIANVIDRILSTNASDKKIIFIIATLSSAELPQQFENKLNEYKHYLENNNLIVKNIQSPSSSKKEPKRDYNFNLNYDDCDVMIFGKSSFGKGRIFTDNGILEGMLDSIKNDDNVELIYIRDEAHIGTDNKNKENESDNNFEKLVNSIASFSIQMTATPEDNDNLVEITEKDLWNDPNMQLLKKNCYFNLNLGDSDKVDDNDVLDKACKEFIKIRKKYKNKIEEPHLEGINPAMLIQIRSRKTSKDQITDEELEKSIKKYKEIIENNGLIWATYFSEEKSESKIREKITLKDLSANNSGVDVILFKVGPATGWDIPRACMLVQLRKVFSSTLNIQTIGRIKRNPVPNIILNSNSIANNYYIYSNVIKITENEIISWKIKDEIKKLNYKVFSGSIKKIESTNYFDRELYKNDLEEIISLSEIELKLDNTEEKYQKDGYLVGEEISYKVSEKETKSKIISKLYNKIDLRIFINKQKQTNKKYFTMLGENYLNNLFYKVQKNINKNYFTQDLFEYIIYKELLPQIINKYKRYWKKAEFEADSDFYELNTNEITEYFVQQKNLISKKFLHKIKNKTEESFAYSIKLFDDLILDSEPESLFMKHLDNFLRSKKSLKNHITLWTRNQAHSGFSFDYLEKDDDDDDDVIIRKSYPDLLLVVNKNHMVFVEVKSASKDIDNEKTKQMLKSYEKYVQKFQQNQKSKLFFNNNEIHSLTMVVYKPKLNDAYIEGFSSIDKLNDFLKNKKGKQLNSEFKQIIQLIN